MEKRKVFNIGIDIDGTITTPYYWREAFNKIFNKNLKDEDCTDYNLEALYDNKNFWSIVFNNHIKEYLDSVDIRPEVLSMLKLIRKRHNCCIITARTNEGYIKERTIDYLKMYRLDNMDLHMLSSHHKAEQAKTLNIDVFIEDSGSNALELAECGIKVFLLDTNYNQNVEHENIIRVEDWVDIYIELEKYIQQLDRGIIAPQLIEKPINIKDLFTKCKYDASEHCVHSGVTYCVAPCLSCSKNNKLNLLLMEERGNVS